MSGSSPEKEPDETQAETTRIQATHTPKSKDESPDQNQQSQCQLLRPQQSESKRKRKRTHTGQSSEEPRITSPDAVVYKPNQSDEELQEKARAKKARAKKARAKSQKYAFSGIFLGASRLLPKSASRPLAKRSAWMEEKFTYPPQYFLSQNQQNPPQYSQSQNQQNNIQAGPASANGPSQPGGSNPVQGNPPSGTRSRVKRFLCFRN